MLFFRTLFKILGIKIADSTNGFIFVSKKWLEDYKIIGNYNSETKFKICISLNCQATEWMCLNTKPNSSTVILNYDLMIKKIKSIHVDLILNAYKISNSLEGLGIKTIGQILKIPKKKVRRFS